MAQQTRISKRFLEALENDRFEQFPAVVYLRGFLKGYCEHLDVNFDEIWAKLSETQPAEAPAADAAHAAAPPAAKAPAPAAAKPHAPAHKAPAHHAPAAHAPQHAADAHGGATAPPAPPPRSRWP
ncbi:MAG: helix-turn-helix domain-containing protein [Elusimicrobiota bacterium]|nr:MAG: helix-turn-helix domain-containing protein [Elusimicrobiota bacterium]